MRPMSTNEPLMDQIIPESEVSVIAAIGPLDPRGEANLHESFDKTTDDIRIDFTSREDNRCKFSSFNIPGPTKLMPWPRAEISGEKVFTARLGPPGGLRGYASITGKKQENKKQKCGKGKKNVQKTPEMFFLTQLVNTGKTTSVFM